MLAERVWQADSAVQVVAVIVAVELHVVELSVKALGTRECLEEQAPSAL